MSSCQVIALEMSRVYSTLLVRQRSNAEGLCRLGEIDKVFQAVCEAKLSGLGPKPKPKPKLNRNPN